MRLIITAFVVVLVLTAAFVAAGIPETCFGKGEKIDGLNKICFYSCPSGDAAITVKSHQLCPLSIKR